MPVLLAAVCYAAKETPACCSFWCTAVLGVFVVRVLYVDKLSDMAGPDEVGRALVWDGVLTGADPSGVAGQLGGSCHDP